MTMQETPHAAASRKFDKVCEILDRHNRQSSRLIPILQSVQEEYRYLPREILTYVATALDIAPARVYGVATFYTHFALQPKGKYLIRVCDGTACHVKQSIPILEAIRETLGLSEKKKTSEDMLFTVETVACLGACGLAPVLVVNEDVHGQMTPKAGAKIADDIRAREGAK
jgi:NADH-quinone oxidoreductase subunit E